MKKFILCTMNNDDCLTFAEAMALDPSEVEWKINCDWLRLGTDVTLGELRVASFRRLSRPRKSRVQEMAEEKRATHTPALFVETAVKYMTDAIRVVCEYLRNETGAGGCYARDIERHFLEPR